MFLGWDYKFSGHKVWVLLGQILTFSGVGPNPGSRPTLVHPTRPKYKREHNLPGPIETT